MIVYKITNKITGECYIGQTVPSLEKRWYEQVYNSRCPAIRDAINKYGEDNFTIEIIGAANTMDELNKKESYWISHYDSIAPNGYNLQSGGKNCRCAESTKQKSSALNSGKNNPKKKIKCVLDRHLIQ